MNNQYDRLGELLLMEETQTLLSEIENEKNTDAERAMNEFFSMHESQHLNIIEDFQTKEKHRLGESLCTNMVL